MDTDLIHAMEVTMVVIKATVMVMAMATATVMATVMEIRIKARNSTRYND